MLKKSLILGALAALTMAPAAFAGQQVQGNTTVTNISAGSVGNGNRTNINNTTNVGQHQGSYKAHPYRRHARKCATGSQVQGNVTDTSIAVGNVGNRNRTNVNNVTNVNQTQSAVCY
ncbi:MAG: hypothetical protein IGS39_24645 [Calothrix sp. C42_A2020_038]|nr:hypothetical protein [Calothrix sp. C42_A2020_038]